MSLVWESGKGSGDENFPVASRLIAARHRPIILAFYRFARLADDAADHPAAAPEAKLERLHAIEASLLGRSAEIAPAVRLAALIAERGLTPRHALDLLTAFRRDVTQSRYESWGALMDYCRFSAAPVGRFVLDVHGEAAGAWPASDALCDALQVINHLQDCGRDYKDLDRVYIPLDALAAAGIGVEALGENKADPALRIVVAGLAGRCGPLLEEARALPALVTDRRLALEIEVIRRLALSLAERLQHRDPLSQRVHHRGWEALGISLWTSAGFLLSPRRRARPLLEGA